MDESTVLIIANEKIYQDQIIGIYQKDFNHLQKSHADIYREFCHEYFPELEELIASDMIGTDCADLFSRLGHLSYVRFADFLELYIPIVEKLSPIQKAWLKENYHTLNEQYDVDIHILVKKDKFTMVNQYPSSIVKEGVIEELKEIVEEKKIESTSIKH